jgi:hypothetical protein
MIKLHMVLEESRFSLRELFHAMGSIFPGVDGKYQSYTKPRHTLGSP